MKNRRLIPLALLLNGLAMGQAIPAEYDGVLKSLGKQGDFKDSVLKVTVQGMT